MSKKPKKKLQLPKKKKISRKERTVAKLAIKNLLLERYVRHFFGMPNENELIDGNNYIIAQDGLYLIRKNQIGKFVTLLAPTEMPVPLTSKKKPVEGFHMSIGNKIPYEFLLKTVAFFKRVYKEKKGAEAVLQIFYNQTDEAYFFNVDEQGVSGGGAEMDRNAELEQTHLLVADIHSHNSMSAFFSGTDNRDEKEARIYGVMGRLDQPWPEIKFRAGDGTGGWIEMSPFQVFETPEIGVVEVPDEWMAKVHTPPKYKKQSHYYQEREGDIRPWGVSKEIYDRYVPPNKRRFGPVGTTEQDEFIYPIEQWEVDIGYELDLEKDSDMFGKPNIDTAIESLIETSDILVGEEAQAMWHSLVRKLDVHAKDVLKKVLDETH
jgi:PRTRC genetic system protein A